MRLLDFLSTNPTFANLICTYWLLAITTWPSFFYIGNEKTLSRYVHTYYALILNIPSVTKMYIFKTIKDLLPVFLMHFWGAVYLIKKI